MRRGFGKIDEEASEAWAQGHLDYTTECLYDKVTGYDDDNRPIDVLAWRHLEIVLDKENVPFVRRRGEQATTLAAYCVWYFRKTMPCGYLPR